VKQFASNEIRNVALGGQKGAGKTTLAEAMLYSAKTTTRLGKIDAGNTVLDTEPEAHKRLGSVQAGFAWLQWQGQKVNLLDTPGARDFICDTQNAIAVADTLVTVVSAAADIDPYTQKQFAGAKGARFLVINQLGRERANFHEVLDQAKARLGSGIVALALPIGSEDKFRGVIDLLAMKAKIFDAGGRNPPRIEDVPADLAADAGAARDALIEEIAGADLQLMEKYLEAGALTEQEAMSGLKKAVGAGLLVPCFPADAGHNIGVSVVLDSLVACAPSPLERGNFAGVKGGVAAEIPRDGNFVGVVFKTLMDPHAGKLSVFRVVAGSASKDTVVHNVSRNQGERLGALMALVGKKTDPMEAAPLGDIVAVAKLKSTVTGDTLAVESDAPCVRLPEVPPTQITFRLLCKKKGEEEKVAQALHKLHEEDPTLVMGHDELTADLTLSGLGVTHIDAALEKMQRTYGLEVHKEPPLVPYRETLSRAAKAIEGKHKKQSGGHGQFGVCYINMRPLPRGEGYKFVDNIFGGSIPRQYIPAVDKGAQEAAARGCLAGYPVVDVEVALYDGKYHDVDSSEMAFKIAGSKGFQEAMRQGGAMIIEPVMSIEVEVPDDAMGDVMGDISSRRGRVLGMDSNGTASVVKAHVPMAEMLTYSPDLNSMTAGRGTFTMQFDHYDPLPAHLTDKVIAASPKKPHAVED
jgi:elongation factor G